jgi:hypothetical protein
MLQMYLQTAPVDGLSAYRPRVVDAELAASLQAAGVVLIEGPRACGKTVTALQVAASDVNLERQAEARRAGRIDPAVLLDGERPRLIDEWQLVPEVWGHVRAAVDRLGAGSGRFILTGSAIPPNDTTRHSGAGRVLRLRMRPMALAESGDSSAEVSLAALFDGAPARSGEAGSGVRQTAELVCRGGWPGLLGRSVTDVQRALRGYLADTAEIDLERADGVHRDPARVRRVIASLARSTSTYASARSIAADVRGAGPAMTPNTVLGYLDALERVFVADDLPAWSPSLRSKTRLRAQAKRHLVDPSLAVAALGTGPGRLALEVDTLGLLFESMVLRDLRVYAQAIDAEVFGYLDSSNLEADAVIETRDGRWGALEVKLGPREVEDGAASLLRIAARVDADRHGAPAVLAVITGWGYAYTRPDGVAVIPVGALGP